MRYTLLAVSAFVVRALALPSLASVRHVVHEKRSSVPHGWARGEKLPGDLVMPMRIALTQSNMDRLDDYLMDVSHPESDNFGKHWTTKEVAEAFAPSKETHDAVGQWLSSAGIPSDRVSQSQSLGWLNFDITVEEAERLLRTEYYIHEHASSGATQVGCDEYHVPEHVSGHIDFITPTLHFDTKIGPRKDDELNKRDSVSAVGHPVKKGTGHNLVNAGNLPKPGITLPNLNGVITDLQNCYNYTTLACLRVLYLIPPVFTNLQDNPFGIVEYTPEAYLQSDLDLFFANFSRLQVHKTPVLDSIDGGIIQTDQQSFYLNGESDLDLQYGMALANPVPVTLYQVGDPYAGASFNNFLDAIDGSYCTFQGGDDSEQDVSYPDLNFPAGYKGPNNCGGFAATKVISTSYGYNEADLTASYEARQCQEYAKLGLQGTTVVYSSGDYGVAGNSGQCIDPVSKLYNEGLSGIFNPAFPSTCPYVTAVGATQVKRGALVFDSQPEEACETIIYSGGGFSNVFSLPSYQSAAVGSYYAKHNPPYGADRYNNSRAVRGYPDVSANGANYVVAVDGEFKLVYGTSASAPTFASIVTIVNEYRAAIGKGPVGFVNPTLYAHPEAFYDVVQGGNQGCGTPGFTAVEGWDPVTGLGTPNTPKLLELYLRMK